MNNAMVVTPDGQLIISSVKDEIIICELLTGKK
jgi:hypothetical protein